MSIYCREPLPAALGLRYRVGAEELNLGPGVE